MHVSLCYLFYAATDSNPHPSLYINILGVLIAGYYLLVILIPWKMYMLVGQVFSSMGVLRRDINAVQIFRICIADFGICVEYAKEAC